MNISDDQNDTNLARGYVDRDYRRMSRRHSLISCIDRPDWVTVLAEHAQCAPADFYQIGEAHPTRGWCDYVERRSK